MAVMVDPSSPSKMFTSVVDGLKKLYEKKCKPLEVAYRFGEFYSPLLSSSDFDARPMVLLIGQYSVGKTTFIRHLLGRDFPGQHIGPEPTTDRFLAVMHGPEERIIPGNTLAVQADMPFRAVNKFGSGFLNKFQAAIVPAPILEEITLIDTPGILAGEKQSLGRSYDFTAVTEWFAERSDLVLLLFDAHKLDVSDELKRTIQVLKAHDDKIRIVLNKADGVDGQQLMRVYGALMWSLGKVVQTPEVMRVFIGSFWERPIQNRDFENLFAAERADLFKEMHSLPRNSAFRKVNDLVKRARLAKVHAYILAHLKNEMPMFFGKADRMAELIKNLDGEFRKIQQQYRLPPGDFPNLERFRVLLKNYDFDNFAKVNMKLIQSLEEVLTVDIPNLLQQFPYGELPTPPPPPQGIQQAHIFVHPQQQQQQVQLQSSQQLQQSQQQLQYPAGGVVPSGQVAQQLQQPLTNSTLPAQMPVQSSQYPPQQQQQQQQQLPHQHQQQQMTQSQQAVLPPQHQQSFSSPQPQFYPNVQQTSQSTGFPQQQQQYQQQPPLPTPQMQQVQAPQQQQFVQQQPQPQQFLQAPQYQPTFQPTQQQIQQPQQYAYQQPSQQPQPSSSMLTTSTPNTFALSTVPALAPPPTSTRSNNNNLMDSEFGMSGQRGTNNPYTLSSTDAFVTKPTGSDTPSTLTPDSIVGIQNPFASK